MTRRNFIALVSLCVLAMLGVMIVGGGLFATRSERGQSVLRGWLEARIGSSINGHVHIGHVRGNFLTGVTIDSLELRDDEDSLFVATGPVALEYDPRDLVDRRLYFRRVTLDHPTVVLRQHENWKWNYRKIFRIGRPQKKVTSPERGFGDFVILDSVHIRNGGSFRLTIPWHPDDSLHGVRKDSAVNATIARKDHEIRRTREGFTQTYRWTGAYAFLPHVRVADPDSVGQQFTIDTLNVAESTPPFMWRNIHGSARILGDSAWMTIQHFDLPGSTGRAYGKIWWGSDLPVRYGLHITGDSVSLADVAWVYPTLPTTGSGSMLLDIQNEKNLNLLAYVIRDMDVRSTKSRLRGQMTFAIGGPVLAVHDVKLIADPVDFDLLRTLNGKPFPADWQGKLTGTVTARGGPLTHFYVDGSDITFRDAHVAGAVSHMQGKGELDILLPAFTAFHNFFASTDRLDLRTLVAIYPSFPRIKGIVSGTTVLDSSWLDVRVSNANLTHTDGPAEPTHATGSGTITYGIPFMTYDLSLQASPLSLTTLAESYPKFPLRGTLSGPLRVRGTAPDLEIVADLNGSAGHLTYAGRADADSVNGYGAKGSGTFDLLDVSPLFGISRPSTRLAGRFDVDLLGDSLANLAGGLRIALDSSAADGIRIAGGVAGLRFEQGILRVDTLRLRSTAAAIAAKGSIGLTRSAGRDSLVIDLVADSLGGLRKYLGTSVQSDSLGGTVRVHAGLTGWLDSLGVNGSLTGRDLAMEHERARSLSGTISLLRVRDHAVGDITLRADTIVVGGIHVDTARVMAHILDVDHATFAGGLRTDGNALLRTAGDWRSARDTQVVRLDTLNVAAGESRYALQRPSVFVRTDSGAVVDTLLFADQLGGRLAGFLDAPTSRSVRGRLRADSIALADLGVVAQLASPLTGRMSFDLTVSGTRDLPLLSLTSAAEHVTYSGLSTELISMDGRYAGNRAEVQANILRGGRSILDATVSYPVALTLFSAKATGDSLRGRVHADSVELALIEALSPKIRNTTGRLALDLALSGAPSHPHVGGTAAVTNGGIEVPEAGIRFASLNGLLNVDAAHDSISIQRMRWISPGSGGDASLQGSVVFRDLTSPRLDLQLNARGLRAVDKRGLARLDVSTESSGLVLRGSPDAATLTGAVTIDHGTIYIPELVRKQVEDLTPDDFAQLFDTTDVRNRSLMPQPPSVLVEHLLLNGVSVRLGEDVWLRSREASIKLGGSLNVTRAIDDRETTLSRLGRKSLADSARYKLALSGTLSADRGTYTLDLTAVQREFQVQSGRITFFGTPDFNPEIDVSALYQVKQSNRTDVDIRARIHGNFYPQPALELSSNDAYLSPSDLVSYLVTGQPISELSGRDLSASQRAFEFVLPTLGASVGRVLRDQLGGAVDLIQIQSGAVNDPSSLSTGSTQFRSILSSTRLGGEKQISDKLFLSFSTGLCQLGGSNDDAAQQGLVGFANAIEGKLEYRFPLLAPERLSLRAGREPPASALRCGADRVRGFVATPQQWGFSLFRSWSF